MASTWGKKKQTKTNKEIDEELSKLRERLSVLEVAEPPPPSEIVTKPARAKSKFERKPAQVPESPAKAKDSPSAKHAADGKDVAPKAQHLESPSKAKGSPSSHQSADVKDVAPKAQPLGTPAKAKGVTTSHQSADGKDVAPKAQHPGSPAKAKGVPSSPQHPESPAKASPKAESKWGKKAVAPDLTVELESPDVAETPGEPAPSPSKNESKWGKKSVAPDPIVPLASPEIAESPGEPASSPAKKEGKWGKKSVAPEGLASPGLASPEVTEDPGEPASLPAKKEGKWGKKSVAPEGLASPGLASPEVTDTPGETIPSPVKKESEFTKESVVVASASEPRSPDVAHPEVAVEASTAGASTAADLTEGPGRSSKLAEARKTWKRSSMQQTSAQSPSALDQHSVLHLPHHVSEEHLNHQGDVEEESHATATLQVRMQARRGNDHEQHKLHLHPQDVRHTQPSQQDHHHLHQDLHDQQDAWYMKPGPRHLQQQLPQDFQHKQKRLQQNGITSPGNIAASPNFGASPMTSPFMSSTEMPLASSLQSLMSPGFGAAAQLHAPQFQLNTPGSPWEQMDRGGSDGSDSEATLDFDTLECQEVRRSSVSELEFETAPIRRTSPSFERVPPPKVESPRAMSSSFSHLDSSGSPIRSSSVPARAASPITRRLENTRAVRPSTRTSSPPSRALRNAAPLIPPSLGTNCSQIDDGKVRSTESALMHCTLEPNTPPRIAQSTPRAASTPILTSRGGNSHSQASRFSPASGERDSPPSALQEPRRLVHSLSTPRTEHRDGSMEHVFAPSERQRLVGQVFRACDINSDNSLNEQEMRRFARYCGFSGHDEDWRKEFERLCFEYDLADGVNFQCFEKLVNDPSDRGCFCSDVKLKYMLEELNVTELGHIATSQTQHPRRDAALVRRVWPEFHKEEETTPRHQRQRFWNDFVKVNAARLLDAVSESELREVRSFNKPPRLVEMVLANVHCLLNIEEDWHSIRQSLRSAAALMQQLRHFDLSRISLTLLQRMRRRLKQCPAAFSPETVAPISEACCALCQWVNLMCWCAGEQQLIHKDADLLNRLDKGALSKVASFVRPPMLVSAVLGNVHCLLGLDDQWQHIQRSLRSSSEFLHQLQYLNQQSITAQIIATMQKRFLRCPHSFRPEIVAPVCKVCAVLCEWVIAVCVRAGVAFQDWETALPADACPWSSITFRDQNGNACLEVRPGEMVISTGYLPGVSSPEKNRRGQQPSRKSPVANAWSLGAQSLEYFGASESPRTKANIVERSYLASSAVESSLLELGAAEHMPSAEPRTPSSGSYARRADDERKRVTMQKHFATEARQRGWRSGASMPRRLS